MLNSWTNYASNPGAGGSTRSMVGAKEPAPVEGQWSVWYWDTNMRKLSDMNL